jgi:hypothetical protein
MSDSYHHVVKGGLKLKGGGGLPTAGGVKKKKKKKHKEVRAESDGSDATPTTRPTRSERP